MGDLPLPLPLDLVAGERIPPALVLTEPQCDANTGAALHSRCQSDPNAIDRAVQTAHDVHEHGTWSDVSITGRADALRRLADQLDTRAEPIAVAEALTTGVPLSVTRMMASSLGGTVRGVAELMEDGILQRRLPGPSGEVVLSRLPWGPAALIIPWNAPAAVSVGKIANALAMGCPVIVKPSEWGSPSVGLVVDAGQAAELPSGVLQLLHGAGSVGAVLVADPRIAAISFTGGQATGRAIATAAAPRFAALQLELGGANPVLVLADADIWRTAASLVAGATKLNGQWCEAPRRVFVARELHDPLVDALHTTLSGLVIGSSLDAATDVGPLSHEQHRQRIREAIEAAELTGGEVWHHPAVPSDGGWFFPPTVVTGLPQEATVGEVFGPVLFIHPVDTEAEALAQANAGEDGLAAYVFAADIEHAMTLGSRLRAGEVKINGTSILDLTSSSAQSFWGASGIGGHGAEDVLNFFGGNRIVGVDHPSSPL